MGCGASGPVHPNELYIPEEPPRWLSHEPKGVAHDFDESELAGYLGLHSHFHVPAATSEEEVEEAAAVFSSLQVNYLSDAYTVSVFADAITKWVELSKCVDVKESGCLELDALEPLWESVFLKLCQACKAGSVPPWHETRRAKEAQLAAFQRFAKTCTPNGDHGKFTFADVQAYFIDVLIKEADGYQLKRNEAYAAADMSAAAAMFRELDQDANQTLAGEELKVLAAWLFSTFRPAGKPMSEATQEKESAALFRRLNPKGGNSPGALCSGTGSLVWRSM